MDEKLFTLPNGEEVIFNPEPHTYTLKKSGKELISITTLLAKVNGNDYSNVNPELLKRSADYGTAVHEELDTLINMREVGLDISNLPKHQETKNYFEFVEPIYKIEPIMTEKVVVLYDDNGEAVAAGRFDLICKVQGELTLADFKTTSSIHTQSVTAQLNLYAVAAIQSGYFKEGEIKGLGVIHLSGETSKYRPIPMLKRGFLEKYIEK